MVSFTRVLIKYLLPRGRGRESLGGGGGDGLHHHDRVVKEVVATNRNNKTIDVHLGLYLAVVEALDSVNML